jgi:hypothetical protein
VIPAAQLPPGDTVILFQSDRPAVQPGAGDARRLTFSIRDLAVEIRGRR